MSPQYDQGDVSRAAHKDRRLGGMGNSFRDKAGNTVLHLGVSQGPSLIHACAAAGVNINTQNFAGDTALHVAVREGQREAARALLMAGTDLALKNKLGQTALEVASSELKDLVNEYRPGLVQAVVRGEFAAINRLVARWCNPNSVIKDGKSALMLLSDRSQENGNFQRCYNLLRSHQRSLELIHAVLSDDVEQLKRILEEHPTCNVNTRYLERGGWTPVACAVFQQNLELLRQLVATGRAQLQLRVRESQEAPSQPLYFCTLFPGCPAELWRYVHQVGGSQQCKERNYTGDTAFFFALSRGLPCSFLQQLLEADHGAAITQRNKDGFTPRQVAQATGRGDVVGLIDKYLFDQLSGELLMRLPVTFYGKEHLTVKHESGRTLQECAEDGKMEEAVQATKHYQAVEDYGVRLFQAAATGDLKAILRHNKAPYVDQNGFTALTRALVFDQLRAAEILLVERPELRITPDNCNRYPLHYAYSLPEEQGTPFIELLLDCDQAVDLEHRLDKDGREAAEYRDLRGSEEVNVMLHDARTRDPYGKVGSPMGALPNHTETC